MSINTPRIYIFDNVKALLIILVVLGHASDYYTHQFEEMRFFFFFTYLFHMPLFIFLAGLFSKSTILKNPFRIEKVAYFLILYIILKVLYYLIHTQLLGATNYKLNLFETDGVPWFMFAMAVWLIIGRLIRKIPPYITLPISILFAVLIGYTEVGDFLMLSRIFVFFPYFLLGFYIQPRALAEALKSKALLIVSIIVLLSALIIVYTNLDFLYTARNILSGRNSYDRIQMQFDIPLYGAILRLSVTIITIVLSIAVMKLMTHKRTWFTVLGERSLAIYFFHRFILFIYHHYNMNDYLSDLFPQTWLYIYLLLFALIAVSLAWRPFEWILQMIQKPVDALLKSPLSKSRESKKTTFN